MATALLMGSIAFIPVYLVAFAFQGRMLVPRDAWAPWAGRALSLVIPLALGSSKAASAIAVLIVGFGVTFLCYADGWRKKLFCAAALISAGAFCEAFGVSVWMVVTQGEPANDFAASWRNYPEHVASSLVAAAAIAVYLRVLERELRRLGDALATRRYMGFAVLFLLQALAFTLVSKATMVTAWRDGGLFFASAAAGFVCIASSVALMRSEGVLHERDRMRREADALQEDLDELLERYDAQRVQVSRVAVMRHDARNHLQVIRSLTKRGETARAAAYAREMAARARSVDVPEAETTAEPHAQGADARLLGACAAGGGTHAVRAVAGDAAASVLAAAVLPLSVAALGALIAAQAMQLVWRRARVLGSWAAAFVSHAGMMVLVVLAAVACGAGRLGAGVSIGVSCCALAFAACLAALGFAHTREEDAAAAAERARVLGEQLAAQRAHLGALRERLHAGEQARMQWAERLERVAAALDAGDGGALDGLLQDADDPGGVFAEQERFCAHEAVDALLAAKATACRAQGIAWDAAVELPARVTLPDAHLVAMFSNMLDNALRAAAQAPAPERFVSVRARLAHGMLQVEVENAMVDTPCGDGRGEPFAHMKSARDRPVGASDADDVLAGVSGHGWGTRILRALAERYEGDVTWQMHDGTCRCSLLARCRACEL